MMGVQMVFFLPLCPCLLVVPTVYISLPFYSLQGSLCWHVVNTLNLNYNLVRFQFQRVNGTIIPIRKNMTVPLTCQVFWVGPN